MKKISYLSFIWMFSISISFSSMAKNIAIETAVEGETINIFSMDDRNIRFAYVYYRLKGSQQYIQQPLVHAENKWNLIFQGNQLRAPAIEYYFQLIHIDGSITSIPKNHPKYNPYRLKVKKNQRLSIMMLPIPETNQQSIEFKVDGYADTETQIMIGDTDVTNMVTREGNVWRVENIGDFIADSTELTLLDSQGNKLASTTVEFTNAGNAPNIKNGELVLRGSAGFNIGGQSDNNANSDNSLVLTGNLHVETEYSNGDFNSHFSGVNINYDDNADKEFNLSSGFLFTNTYKNSSLEIGDVSVKGTPLVLSGFSRRGFVAATEGESWKGSLFNVRTSTVDGFKSGISFDDRQTYGASYEQAVGDAANTNIQVSVVSGELQQPETDNVGSANKNAQSGDTIGIEYSAEYSGVNISAQLAGSNFDEDTSDNNDAISDQAYEVNLTKDIYGLASSLGYQHYGANYATITSPNFSGDRKGLNLSLGSNWKMLGWSTSFSSTEDNVDKNPLRPVVGSDNAGVTFDLLIENWPSINVGYNFSRQSSSNEPVITDKVNNKGQDISLGLSDNFGPYNIAWSSSLGSLKNKLDITNDSDTSNNSLSMGYSFNTTNVNLNLSQNKNKTDFTLTSNLINVSIDVPFFTDDVILNTQFSSQQNSANNQSQDNEIFGGSARIAWTLQDVIVFKGMDWINPQFGLTWTMNKVSDRINNTVNESNNTIMLDFSFGAPYNFEQRWQFNDEQ